MPEIPPNREPPRRIIRVLCSEKDFNPIFAYFTLAATEEGVAIALSAPAGISESDLLEKAAAENWDLAILLLNNIFFPSVDRSRGGIVTDSINLIATLKLLFNRPIICFCALTLSAESLDGLCAAGAEAVFPIPCATEVVVPVIRRVLDEIRGL